MLKFAASAFSLLLCTSVANAQEPKWLRDARAREGKFMNHADIKSKDGWFRARIPGKAVSSIEKVQGSYSVEIDIGGDAPVECEVYPDGIDMANLLRVTLEAYLKHAEESQGKIQGRALDFIDAGAHGAVPYISSTWLYRAAASDGVRVGALKQFAMEKGRHGVYCSHADLGYTQTFAGITRAFAESLVTEERAVKPYYVEVATASVSNSKIGVLVSTLERDADGDTKARQMTAMLLATSDGSVMTQDSTQIAWLRPDGTLINASNADVSNGEVENSLSLKADEDTWIVEGEMQGKAVKTTLPKGSQPASWLAQAQQIRTLLAEPNPVGREHTIGLWIGENPDKLTVARTKILARQGDKHFKALGEVGGITANLTLEKSSGMASVADVKVGPLNMKLERVYVSGSF